MDGLLCPSTAGRHEALRWRRQMLLSLLFSAPLLALAMAAMLPPLMDTLGERPFLV